MSEALAACEEVLMDTRIYSCFIYNNFFKNYILKFLFSLLLFYYTNFIK